MGAPRRRARVLDYHARDRRHAGALWLERPREPARGQRAALNGVLTDGMHDEGYSRCVSEPLLVRAARREEVERTPVWFMRQAGRSLPEYRAIRAKHAFFEVAHTPDLCAEVTLQPVRRHNVDAAVMFADIMTPVLGMGIDVRLVEGIGPVIDEPIRTLADVERLQVPDPEEAFAPVLEAVRLVRAALRPDQAVVGFCGGPFTVAGYLVEGKPSREFALTKSLMLGEPDVWHALLEKLSATFAAYVAAKARAGADVIQLFDSWVGALSPTQYREHVAPHSARVLAAVDVPTIHFGTGTATLLEEMAAAGGDVIGLDWRIPLDVGWAKVPDRAVQGNLDPAVLLAPWDVIEADALDILARAGGRPGHIFNLGHGVFPSVDPDTLTRLAAFVQERSAVRVEARA
jgi:uroporphyrinogen decarboxylase